MVSASESNDTDVEVAMSSFRSSKSETQKKIFTKWMNSKLKQARMQVSDLTRDIRDGQKLCMLLELLTSTPIKGVSNKRLRTLHIQNVNLALNFLRNLQVDFHNISAENIVDGNEKLTLGLIWSIVMKFEIENSFELPAEMGLTASKRGKTPMLRLHEALKKWCSSKLGDYGIEITNFDSCWSDGMAFCALIHKYRPELIDYHSLNPSDNMTNLSIAFNAAEKHLGITSLFDAEDFLLQPDSKCVMTYLAMLYTTLEATKATSLEETPLHMLVTRCKNNVEDLERYESLSKSLMEWVKDHMKPLENFCYPSSLSAMNTLILDTKAFCANELNKKFDELMTCRRLFEKINVGVKVDHQKLEINPALHVDLLNELWNQYEQAFRLHQMEIARKMEFYLHLECQVHEYNKNVEQRKMWILETTALLSRNISEQDLNSLEKLKCKFALLKQEIDIFKPRIDQLLMVCDDLEKIGYFDVTSIKFKKFEIVTLWKTLNSTYENRYAILLDKIANLSDFKDVEFMKVWKDQMEKQLEYEASPTNPVQLLTALKMLSFVESNFAEYKKQADKIISTGEVERSGQMVPIKVNDELKQFLLSDYDDLMRVIQARKKEIATNLDNLNLTSEKMQLDAWLQSSMKKIPEDVSKSLIQSINCSLDGHAKPFMQHDMKQFQSIMKNILDEYTRKTADVDRLIGICENSSDEDSATNLENIEQTKEELCTLKKQLIDSKDGLEGDVKYLVDTAQLSLDYTQKKQAISEYLLSGCSFAFPGSAANAEGDAKEGITNSNASDIQNFIMSRSGDLKDSMKKLVDYLMANDNELTSLGLTPVNEAVEKIQADYKSIKDQIIQESQRILNMYLLRNIKSEMESVATWIDDKDNDYTQLTSDPASNEFDGSKFTKQGIIACKTELTSLGEDQQIVQKTWSKLRELEKELRQIDLPDGEEMNFVQNVQPLNYKLNRITQNINDRKKHLELVRFITSQYDDARFLILSLKEKATMLDNLSKTPNMSNEEIIILHKLVLEQDKQVADLWEKIQSKEATFRNMAKENNVSLDHVLNEFAQMHDLHHHITERISELETCCNSLSDVENFEINFHDMKQWLKATTVKLEDMDEGGAFEHTPVHSIAMSLAGIREELMVRKKELDELEELKRKIDSSSDKSKISQHVKSFKNFRSKIKNIEGLCSKVNSLINEYSKLNMIEFSKNYMEVTILLLEKQLDFDCDQLTKPEVEQTMVRLNSMITREQMLENKLKNIMDSFATASKFVEKKSVSEMKNSLSQLKKRVGVIMKTARKKHRQLSVMNEYLRLWEVFNQCKECVEYRSDMRKLHQKLEADGSTVNFANLCQVSKIEICKVKNTLETITDDLEKIKKRNLINMKSLSAEIEESHHRCNEALLNISLCMKDESATARIENISSSQDVEPLESKMDMLKNWQQLLRGDIQNIDTLNKTLPLIDRSSLVEAPLCNIDASAFGTEVKPKEVINTNSMVSEFREIYDLIDEEYQESTIDMEGTKDMDIISMKDEYVETHKNLNSMLDSHRKSAGSTDKVQDLVATVRSRIDWLDRTDADAKEYCSDTTSKNYQNHSSFVELIHSNVIAYNEQHLEQVKNDFENYSKDEKYSEAIAPFMSLPQKLAETFVNTEARGENIQMAISQKTLDFEVSERCEQFLRWLMLHQGFFTFVDHTPDLSSELSHNDLMTAFMKDLKYVGECELAAIQELVKNAEDMHKSQTPDSDSYVSAESLQNINAMFQHCQESYKQMMELGKSMSEAGDNSLSPWDLKQTLKHYTAWKNEEEHHDEETPSPWINLKDIQNNEEEALEQTKLESYQQLFKLKIDDRSMNNLTTLHPDIFNEQAAQANSPDSVNLLKKFQLCQKEAIANAESKLSMIRALQLKDYVADYCKFFLTRLQILIGYMNEPDLNSEDMPANRILLLVEMTNCITKHLKPKAEVSRTLVNQMKGLTENEEANNKFSDFVRYHTECRNNYDKLQEGITKLQNTMSKRTRVNANKLLLAEVIKICQIVVYQIRRSPPPLNYYDCMFRTSGFNLLRSMFPGLLAEMKKYAGDLTHLVSSEELLRYEMDAVNATARMRAEWEITSEILSCEMESVEYIYYCEKTIEKLRVMKEFTCTLNKHSPSSPIAHCVTLEILTGYKTNYKFRNLKYEDKNISDFLNRRVVNTTAKNEVLLSKLRKTIRKSTKSIRGNKSVKGMKSLRKSMRGLGSSLRKNETRLSLLDDCRAHFSVDEFKDKSRNPNQPPIDKKKFIQKQYMLLGLYVLPDDLKALFNAREDLVIYKTPIREIEINVSGLHPEFKLCIFKQSSKVSPVDILFTFDLSNCNFEGSSSPSTFDIRITTKAGSIFSVELLTMQQYVIWMAYLEIIRHLTASRQKLTASGSLLNTVRL